MIKKKKVINEDKIFKIKFETLKQNCKNMDIRIYEVKGGGEAICKECSKMPMPFGNRNNLCSFFYCPILEPCGLEGILE